MSQKHKMPLGKTLTTKPWFRVRVIQFVRTHSLQQPAHGLRNR